ncbi:MAG: DUF6427 family protein [Bacteroidota bacterium]
MLNLFRNNSIFSLLFLIVFTILIRISPFLINLPIDLNINAPLAQILFEWITTFEDYYYFSVVSASFFVVLQAWLLNHLVIKHSILRKDSFLPALIFVLLNSFYKEQLFLSPQLIANLFIILMFERLCNLYESEKPLYVVLDSGLFLGLAILFNYDTFIYLPLILISVVIITYFNIRFLLASIFGILLPIYLVGVVFYMFDSLNDLLIIIEISIKRNYINQITFNWVKLLPWFLITGITLVSAVLLQAEYFKSKVKTRRIIFTVVIFIIISILIILIENHNLVYAVCYLSIPLSIIIANYFMNKRFVILKEILFLLLVSASVLYQYFI